MKGTRESSNRRSKTISISKKMAARDFFASKIYRFLLLIWLVRVVICTHVALFDEILERGYFATVTALFTLMLSGQTSILVIVQNVLFLEKMVQIFHQDLVDAEEAPKQWHVHFCWATVIK